MKFPKPFLIVLVTVCLANVAQAQSVTGAMNSPMYNHRGHAIYPETFTVKLMVDLGPESMLMRVVYTHQFGGQYGPAISTTPISVSGIDQFIVTDLTDNYFWWVKVRYLYPPGHPNAGQDAVTPVEIGQINPMPQTSLTLLQQVDGQEDDPIYHVFVATYDAGSEYTGYIVFHRQNQSVSWDYEDHTIVINEASTPYVTIDVPNHIWAPGEQCITVTLYYSHDVDIAPDFTGVQIDQIGPVCFEPDITTGVGGNDDPEPCCLQINPNLIEDGTLRVSGFVPDQPLKIYALNGQFIRLLVQMPAGDLMTADVSDLAAGEYLLQQVLADESRVMACKFVKR